MSVAVIITPTALLSLPLDARRDLPAMAAIYVVMAGGAAFTTSMDKDKD